MSALVMDRSSVDWLDLACSRMGLEFGWEDLRAGGGFDMVRMPMVMIGAKTNKGNDWIA